LESIGYDILILKADIERRALPTGELREPDFHGSRFIE